MVLRMKEQSIRPVKEFRLSDLFLDFLEGKPTVRKYFGAESPAKVAEKLSGPKVDRIALSDVLYRQNTVFRAKPTTYNSIEKLRAEDSVCIFAGQQAGLFGGPLFTLYKAVGIVKTARILEKELKRPVIPIFWIASDDHDFEEINRAFFLNQSGKVEKIIYDSPPPGKVSAAEIKLDDEQAYTRLISATQNAFGRTDFTDDLYARLFAAYSQGNNFVTAFGQYLLDILPDFGLVLFTPADKELKRLSKGFFKRLVEGHFQIKRALQETAEALEADGYHLQVEKKESAIHLFYHSPQRTPIHFVGDQFLVAEKKLGLPALMDLIEKHPERFSPDVLSRPLWQSYLFPVIAQTGGPSEIAYFSQIGKLFEVLNLTRPFYYCRPALTIIERRHEIFLHDLGLNLIDLTGDVESLINRITAQSFPKEMEAKISNFREKFEEDFREFFAAARKFDEGLEPMGKQTYGKIDFALGAFEKKIYDSHKKRMESTRGQIYKLAAALFPEKNLQERSLNVNYYIAKYGFGIVDFLADKIDPEIKDHQIVYISEFLASE
jgi:bacillithiol biosynthesis cysteine-adding enzyme BshC